MKASVIALILVSLIYSANSQCYETYATSFGYDNENDMLDILQNDNLEVGSWSNPGNALSSFDLFGALSADNTAYFGFSDLTFNGLIFTIDTALSSGDSSKIAVEYWDSSSWVQIPTMSFLGSIPSNSYGGAFFERVQCERMMLGLTPGWTIKTLNSITDYWIRF